jgi:hypothetical protein
MGQSPLNMEDFMGNSSRLGGIFAMFDYWMVIKMTMKMNIMRDSLQMHLFFLQIFK